MISRLKKLDAFGSKVEFNFAGQNKSHSFCGLSVTVICFAVILASLYVTGSDIFRKINPQVVTSELFFQDPEKMTITPESFSFAFGLETPGSLAHFIDETIYKVKVKHITQIKVTHPNGTISDRRTTKYIGVERCTAAHFGVLASKFDSLPLTDLYCLDINDTNYGLELQGLYESPLYQTLTIELDKCTGSPECKTTPEINEKLDGGYFAIYYPNLGMDLKNFKEPADRNRDSFFTSVTGKFKKYGLMWLKHVELATDNGFMFEDFNYENFIVLDNVREMTTYEDNPTQIMSFDLRIEKIKTYYKRSYVKLQDIFADVDGIATLLALITIFLVKPYADMKFHEGIINEVFDIKQDDNNGGGGNRKRTPRRRRSNRQPSDLQSPSERVEEHILGQKPNTFGETSAVRNLDSMITQENHNLKETSRNNGNSPTRTDCTTYIKQSSNRSRFSRIPTAPEGDMEGYAGKVITLDVGKYNTFGARVSDKKRVQTLQSEQHRNTEENTPTFDHPTLGPIAFGQNVEKLEKIDLKVLEDVPEGEEDLQAIEQKQDDENGENGEARLDVENIESALDQIVESPIGKEDTKRSIKQAKEVPETPQRNNEAAVSIDDGLSVYDEEEREQQTSPPRPSKAACFGFFPKRKSQKIKIGFFEFLMSYIWMPKGLKKKMSILDKGIKKVEKKLDIFSLLRNIREIEKLKILLLENEQLVLFDNLPKPVLELRHDIRKPATMSYSHYLLKKSTLNSQVNGMVMNGVAGVSAGTGVNGLVLQSYKKLRSKPQSTLIDQKLVTLYNEILNE